MFVFPFTVLAALALAAPSDARFVHRQSTPSWCAGLGPDTFDSATPVSLIAYNTTDTALSSGEPIILGTTDQGEGAVQIGVLATASSVAAATTPPFGPSPFLDFNLSGGALNAIPEPGLSYQIYSSNGLQSHPTLGAMLEYEISQEQVQAPVQVWCAIGSPSSSVAQLAIWNQPGSFSLCTNTEYQYNIVIVNAAEDTGSYYYNYDTCYNVTLNLIEQA